MDNFGQALLGNIKGELIDAKTNNRLGGEKLKEAILSTITHINNGQSSSSGPIILALELTLESVIAYIAALVSGRTVIPIDLKEWKIRGEDLLIISQPAVCWFPARIKDIKYACNTSEVVQGISILDAYDRNSDLNMNFDKKSNIRLLVPTSGSMGKPAIVCQTDENLLSNTVDIIKSQQLSNKDKALLCLPIHYCFGASILHSHLWAGGSVVIDGRLMFPEKVLDTLKNEECTTFAGVPTSFMFLSSNSTVLLRKFSKLRLWLLAGGYLGKSIIQAFRNAHDKTHFMVMYGQTEATARISAFIATDDDNAGCVGFPMGSLAVEIRSDSGEVVKSGDEGNIWVKGASICPGYFKETGRISEKFIKNWLNTGDIGYLLDNEKLHITGRADSFIKVRGRRINAIEIEDIIWDVVGIHCCACAISDINSGEVIGLYLAHLENRSVVVNTHSSALSVDKIRQALPVYWDVGPIIIGELPFTPNGKVNRRQCQKLLIESWE